MGNFFKGVLIVFISITISCGKDRKTESTGEADAKTDLNKTDSRSAVEFSDNKVQEIYASYLTIKAAMVNSDSKTVQIESEKLEAIIDDAEENKQFKAVSKLISLTKEMNKQRDFFVTLTNEVVRVISKAEIKSGEIYKQFCPMAIDGEGGYWLSDSKEIRNPYFGNKMLSCGSVKEVLKQNKG